MNIRLKSNIIRLGTRKSPLAIAQATQIRDMLLSYHPNIQVEIVPITTSGDKFTEKPLADIGGKGLFTKEIEEGLLDGSLDIAVHSMKDMPTKLPDGLIIGAMTEREDPRDVLIAENIKSLNDLKEGAVFGTSSLRRASLVKIKRPDINIVSFRGNVETRLKKLKQGVADATMLAQAGLNRLKLSDVGSALDIDEFLPAVAQGVVGVECRGDDTKILDLLAPLNHTNSAIAANCERSFLATLDGSCRTPISGHAVIEGDNIFMRGLLAKPDGSQYYTAELKGNISDYENIGIAVGEEIKRKRDS
ncbi:MAG: hydroxymethylbilane synthase [Rickettsiales bacterium]